VRDLSCLPSTTTCPCSDRTACRQPHHGKAASPAICCYHLHLIHSKGPERTHSAKNSQKANQHLCHEIQNHLVSSTTPRSHPTSEQQKNKHMKFVGVFTLKRCFQPNQTLPTLKELQLHITKAPRVEVNHAYQCPRNNQKRKTPKPLLLLLICTRINHQSKS